MKIILLIALFFAVTFCSFSQTDENNKPRGILQFDHSNIVYRGVEYSFSAIAHGGYEETVVVGKNVIIKRDTSMQYAYTAVFGKSDEASIQVGARNKGKRVALGVFFFEVRDVPAPSVYIDNVRSGEIISKSMDSIQLKHPEERYLKEEFNVESWTLKIANLSLEGKGAQLSEEAKKAILKAPNESSLILEVTSSGQRKQHTGIFLIRD